MGFVAVSSLRRGRCRPLSALCLVLAALTFFTLMLALDESSVRKKRPRICQQQPMKVSKIVIINLAHQQRRLQRVLESLVGTTLPIERFNALTPDDAAGELVRSWVCPAKTLGCFLSHRRLARDQQGEEEAVLVLEDDVYPTVPAGELRDAVDTSIRSARPGWDIIVLNTAGWCGATDDEHPGRLCGSAAAYLLSPSGARKLGSIEHAWHVDVIRNGDLFDVRLGPALFRTRDLEETGLIIGGRDIAWYARQPLLGPFSVWTTVPIVLAAVGFLFCGVSTESAGGKRLVFLLAATALLVPSAAFMWFSTHDSGRWRCSRETGSLFVLTFAVGLLIIAHALYSGSGNLGVSVTALLLVAFSLCVACIGRASLRKEP
jgi:hypothetical protein